MGNINSLNTLLDTVDTTGKQLIEAYRRVCPLALEPSKAGETERDALDYCSGATQFVIGYLTGNPGLYIRAQSAAARKALNSTTAKTLLPKFSGPGVLRIGYLLAQGGLGHECVFAGSGNQWAFYQANNGDASQSFTLAPSLNPMKRNWCVNDMNRDQFEDFFVGLTNPAYSARLFPVPMSTWSLAGFSATGQNLLA
jgi:hypothetical protein